MITTEYISYILLKMNILRKIKHFAEPSHGILKIP